MADAAIQRNDGKSDQVRCVWKRQASGVYGAVPDKGIGLDECFGECVAGSVERDASDRAIEVRWSDSGWGADNDRNLIGRFSTQTISVPRLGVAQSVFLKQYDASSPAKYSRSATVLHVDRPL